jgi:hypothetical protein
MPSPTLRYWTSRAERGYCVPGRSTSVRSKNTFVSWMTLFSRGLKGSFSDAPRSGFLSARRIVHFPCLTPPRSTPERLLTTLWHRMRRVSICRGCDRWRFISPCSLGELTWRQVTGFRPPHTVLSISVVARGTTWHDATEVPMGTTTWWAAAHVPPLQTFLEHDVRT